MNTWTFVGHSFCCKKPDGLELMEIERKISDRPPCAGGDGFGTWTDSLHPRKMLRPPYLGCSKLVAGSSLPKFPGKWRKFQVKYFFRFGQHGYFINHLVEVLGWNPTLVIFRDFIFTMNTRIIPMNQPDQWFDQISGFSGDFWKKIGPSFRCEFSPVNMCSSQVGRQQSWWLRLQRWFSSLAAMNFIDPLGGKCSDTCWWQTRNLAKNENQLRVGSWNLPLFTRVFSTIPWWLVLGFLNHQQYCWSSSSWCGECGSVFFGRTYVCRFDV